MNTLTQVHSALAGCDVRNLWLLDKVTCVQPSSPPELSPSPPFPSPEFQSCLPSTPLNLYSSSPCSSPFQHHQPFWLSSLSPCPSPKKSKLSASSVDSDETRLALSPSPLPSPTLSVDSDETRLAKAGPLSFPSPYPYIMLTATRRGWLSLLPLMTVTKQQYSHQHRDKHNITLALNYLTPQFYLPFLPPDLFFITGFFRNHHYYKRVTHPCYYF